MIPAPDQALRGMMATLTMEIAPCLPDEYRKATASLMAFALMVIAVEVDRAADIAACDNRQMRQLFAAAAPVVCDVLLRRRLEEAARAAEPDLRLSTLTAANHELRRLLIELHAEVEEQEDPAARELCGRIWLHLQQSARRRAIPL